MYRLWLNIYFIPLLRMALRESVTFQKVPCALTNEWAYSYSQVDLKIKTLNVTEHEQIQG